MSDMKWMIAREIPHLRRYARALTRSADEADDLVQDCLERALRKRHLWRRSGRLRSWLFRMLYNIYLNHRRTLSRRPALRSIDEESVPEPVAPASQESRIECQRVGEALERLPVAQRDAILLVSLEGMPYDEAAWILDIPVGTLRSRLSRGRDALRETLVATRPTPLLRRVK